MASTLPKPKFGEESFSCPHCDAVTHHEWYSLFLKPEKAAELDILTPERVSERDGISELDQFVQRLRKNELTYGYQKHPQPMKVRMANLHVSRCNQCNGFAIWVSNELDQRFLGLNHIRPHRRACRTMCGRQDGG